MILATAIQIDIDVVMWLVGGAVTLFMMLLGAIWALFNKSLNSQIKNVLEKIEEEERSRLEADKGMSERIKEEERNRIDVIANVNVQIGKINSDTHIEAKNCADKFANLSDRIHAEAKERAEKQDGLRTLVFADIERWKERINDIDVTVASFGGTYVTRNELDARREEK